jgi:hypothetical protein
MKDLKQVTGVCKITRRLKSSVNGNPRYEVSINGITCVTGVDSSYGYSIGNYNNVNVIALVGMHYNRLCISMVRAF